MAWFKIRWLHYRFATWDRRCVDVYTDHKTLLTNVNPDHSLPGLSWNMPTPTLLIESEIHDSKYGWWLRRTWDGVSIYVPIPYPKPHPEKRH